MRMLMIVLTAVASVLVTGWAEAGEMDDLGLGNGFLLSAVPDFAYALAGAAIAALIRASPSGEPQSAGPTRRPISCPSRSMSSVVGMPTAFSAPNSLPEGSV
jgi:hypothetical protein